MDGRASGYVTPKVDNRLTSDAVGRAHEVSPDGRVCGYFKGLSVQEGFTDRFGTEERQALSRAYDDLRRGRPVSAILTAREIARRIGLDASLPFHFGMRREGLLF